MESVNPIECVRHSENGPNLYVPVPHIYSVSGKKLSKDTATRTESYYMHPDFVGRDQIIHIGWEKPTFEQGKTILNAFDPDRLQGIWVKFLSPWYGWIVEEMYTGDVPAPMMKRSKVYWETIEFDLTTKQTKWRDA